MAKKKTQPTDGLGPKEVQKIRTALRQVWHRSHARKVTVLRCTDAKGWTYCEECHKRTPKLKIDHTLRCGDVDSGYIKRLFCSSKHLRGMCDKCHKTKTKAEMTATKAKKMGF